MESDNQSERGLDQLGEQEAMGTDERCAEHTGYMT